MLKRLPAALGAALLFVTLTGCTPRADVYFQNNTDQDLLLVDGNSQAMTTFDLPASSTTTVEIVDPDQCTTGWLIYAKDGKTLVKDPGKFCGRQTITIP